MRHCCVEIHQILIWLSTELNHLTRFDFMSRCSNAASSCHGLWSTNLRRKEGGQCARRQYNFYGESVCAARRPLIGLALLAATLCALVFPGAAQKGDVPVYKNVSYVHNVLSSGSWSGSGYDDDETALYLFRPTDSLSGSICT